MDNIFFKGFLIYLIVINIISVFVTIFDKRAAISGRRRVPEKTLLVLSAIGGSVGMYITMRAIRHKTLHAKFMVGIPAIFLVQCVVVFLLCKYVFF